MNVRLFSPRPIVGQSFKGVHKHVVPKQSMTVKEIFARFVRKESLPIEREGYYEDRFGDLEKLSKRDIVDQMEVVEALKKRGADLKAKAKAKAEAEAEAKAKAEAVPPAPPVPPVS